METKKSPADEFFELNSEQRRSVHFVLCEHALKKWDLYVSAFEQIEYVETVAGSHQEVDKQLPFDAFKAAKQGSKSRNIAKRYQEPILAIQDEDLEFPENITFAYYAIYHLFKKYAQGEIVDDWLIINQALATEDYSETWHTLLNNAIQFAKQ